jgi:hypothetical protein
MAKYPRELFQLQFEFATSLVEKHSLKLEDALFRNTSYYVRIIGHSDEKLPDQNLNVWVELMRNLPEDQGQIADYFYNKYLEKEKSNITTVKDNAVHPCFHAFYHQDRNMYELHLDNNDPLGVLSKERQSARFAELKEMFTSIKSNSNINTNLFVRTWLLNVDAFTRLFPTELKDQAILWNSNNKTYDNTHWGQFIDRQGNFRNDMAEKFREKFRNESYEEFNLYFPCPAKYSELPVTAFYEFYGIN